MTKKPKRTWPTTRKELVTFLWNEGVSANVFKEGPKYAVRFDGVIMATHLRTIGSLSFEEWKRRILNKNFGLC